MELSKWIDLEKKKKPLHLALLFLDSNKILDLETALMSFCGRALRASEELMEHSTVQMYFKGSQVTPVLFNVLATYVLLFYPFLLLTPQGFCAHLSFMSITHLNVYALYPGWQIKPFCDISFFVSL